MSHGDGCTHQDFSRRQHEYMLQVGQLAYEIYAHRWQPLRNRRRRRELNRIHAESERNYAEHMVRDAEGRLVFRCPGHP